MGKLISMLENSLAPRLNKINNNIWIQTLKDSMMQILPLILVGSLVTILTIFQDFIPNAPNFWAVQGYTMGLIGIIVSFLIPFNYMEKKNLKKLRIVAGMTSFAMYIIMIHLGNPEAFDFGSLGAGGMFAAIIGGIVAGLVYMAGCRCCRYRCFQFHNDTGRAIIRICRVFIGIYADLFHKLLFSLYHGYQYLDVLSDYWAYLSYGHCRECQFGCSRLTADLHFH